MSHVWLVELSYEQSLLSKTVVKAHIDLSFGLEWYCLADDKRNISLALVGYQKYVLMWLERVDKTHVVCTNVTRKSRQNTVESMQ